MGIDGALFQFINALHETEAHPRNKHTVLRPHKLSGMLVMESYTTQGNTTQGKLLLSQNQTCPFLAKMWTDSTRNLTQWNLLANRFKKAPKKNRKKLHSMTYGRISCNGSTSSKSFPSRNQPDQGRPCKLRRFFPLRGTF